MVFFRIRSTIWGAANNRANKPYKPPEHHGKQGVAFQFQEGAARKYLVPFSSGIHIRLAAGGNHHIPQLRPIREIKPAAQPGIFPHGTQQVI